MGYIYGIYCKSNDKVYIGSTSRSSTQRLREHKYRLRKGTHSNKHLQSSWNKYGEGSFEFVIIEHTNNLANIERHYIDITGCYIKEFGFNKSRDTVCASRGLKKSEKLKKQISEKLKGKTSPNKGKKLPSSRKNALKMMEGNQKKVRCIGMGEVYPSVTLAAFCHRRNIATLVEALKKGTKCAGFYWEYV